MRRIAWPLLFTVLMVTAAVAVWPHDSPPRSNEERVEQLSSEIRCPTCAGLSVAESEAPLAQSVREEIATQVGKGQPDKTIKDYFVARYGSDALMNPPRTGLRSVAWALPVVIGVIAIVGLLLTIRRWRSTQPLSTPQAPSKASPVAATATEPAMLPVKKVLGAVFVVTVLGVLAATVTDRLNGDEITGTSSDNVNTLMRKAREYTAKGNGVEAVKTYDKVLKVEPDNVQALTYRGWLVRLAGLPNEGMKTIDKAIEIDPSYPDARVFKGLILLRDQQKPDEAIVQFEAFLAHDPSQDMVPLVQQALDDAKALARVGE